ncbi:MAG: DNA polymerase/3'-5' exonuclease PolX [Phycisphaerales bacterium]|nr:DNA polymerase/3'-5' exonuclease PolX [Phycisphaerales bacterium]
MSDNAHLAEQLDLISKLLELNGADSFRASANARAARAIEAWPADICAVARDRGKPALMEIEGIGPKLADKIIEYSRDGRIKELDELRATTPAGLLDIMQVPGLGPKTVRMLWQEAQVVDRASLQRIIDDGTILTLPRMGAKAVEKIKASLALHVEAAQRLRLGPASAVADRVLAALRPIVGDSPMAFAGSLRRGKDTVGDIDVLLATDDAKISKAAHEAFITMKGVTGVVAGGSAETRTSVQMLVGFSSRWDESDDSTPATGQAGPRVQVDLRIMPRASFGAAIMYFTGSKEHNVAMRQRSLDRGLTLNEYGLFPEDTSTTEAPHKRGIAPVASETEEAIYNALGLRFIAPELRENAGELSAFALDTPPASTPAALVSLSDIRAELHSHTTASDGVLSIVALASEAKRRGFHTIAVTDHSKSSVIAGGLSPERLRAHIRAIHDARNEIEGITILAGSEVDILSDGSLDYDDDLLAALDVVVASPHAALTQDSTTATKRLLRAIEHPLVHILGHPTGRLVLRRAGLSPDMATLVAAAKQHSVALEINAHWMRLDLRDTHVRQSVDAGCVLAINCDVHHPEDFDNLKFGVQTSRRGWLPRDRCINTWDAPKLHAWLKAKR